MNSSEKTVRLYHGTTSLVADLVTDRGLDLYGYIDPDSLARSGNLTDSVKAAEEYANEQAYALGGFPTVLVFDIPARILIFTGETLCSGWLKYATSDSVMVEDLPEEFIEMLAIDRELFEKGGFRQYYYYRALSEYIAYMDTQMDTAYRNY